MMLLLDFVLVDPRPEIYPLAPDLDRVKQLGAEVIEIELVTPHSAPHVDPERLNEILLSMS